MKSSTAWSIPGTSTDVYKRQDDGQIVGLTEPDSDAEKISEIIKTRMEPIQ